jgi:hypothetical protein
MVPEVGVLAGERQHLDAHPAQSTNLTKEYWTPMLGSFENERRKIEAQEESAESPILRAARSIQAEQRRRQVVGTRGQTPRRNRWLQIILDQKPHGRLSAPF